MKKLLFSAISLSSLLAGGAAKADDDLTGTFVPAFTNLANGSSVSIGWTEYATRCLVKVPLTGACASGERERAEGSMRLGEKIESTAVLASAPAIILDLAGGESQPL